MKHIVFVSAIAGVIGAVLGGCGGSRAFNIATGGNGDLLDVRTVPTDGANNVSTNAWVRVYWPKGTEPPPTFRFSLRDGSNTRIYTIKHAGDQPNEWWFEPWEEMDHDSRYKIEILSGDKAVKSLFFTAEEPIVSHSRAAPAGAGPRESKPLEEHVIIVTEE